jgi:hypothetical protein
MKTGIDYLQEVKKRDRPIGDVFSQPQPSRKAKVFIVHGGGAELESLRPWFSQFLKTSRLLEPILYASEASGSASSSRSSALVSVEQYLRQEEELLFTQEQHRKEQDLLEVLLRQRNEQLERAEQEIISLTNRIHVMENQKRMDISYALASEDVKRILNLVANKITLDIDEVAKNITESDVLNVVCDLCKAHLANLKGKKLIVTSLGLKVAKKTQTLND